MGKSPYLDHNDRLGDVISAIQTLGTYRFYKLTPANWADRICGDSGQEARWMAVFTEHPEFFRYSSDKLLISLVLRRQRPKLFDVDSLDLISRQDRDARDPAGQARVTRAPLASSEVEMLIGVACSLHSKALEDRREARWWVPIVVTTLTAVIGLFGVWLGATLNFSGLP